MPIVSEPDRTPCAASTSGRMRSSARSAFDARSSATVPSGVSLKPPGPRSHKRTPRRNSTCRTWRLIDALDINSRFSAAAKPPACAALQNTRSERRSRSSKSSLNISQAPERSRFPRLSRQKNRFLFVRTLLKVPLSGSARKYRVLPKPVLPAFAQEALFRMEALTVAPRTGHRTLLYADLVTNLENLAADIAVLGMA